MFSVMERRFLCAPNLDKLRKASNAYGSLQLLKFCSDMLCLPERFGNHVSCPFCRHKYLVQPVTCLLGSRHIVQCDFCFQTLCWNLFKDRNPENLLYPIKNDRSFLLVRLVNELPRLHSREVKSARHLFAIVALATGCASANLHFNRLQLADSVRQRSLLTE